MIGREIEWVKKDKDFLEVFLRYEVEGVGPKLTKEILNHFDTLEDIKKNKNTLTQIDKIGSKKAEKIIGSISELDYKQVLQDFIPNFVKVKRKSLIPNSKDVVDEAFRNIGLLGKRHLFSIEEGVESVSECLNKAELPAELKKRYEKIGRKFSKNVSLSTKEKSKSWILKDKERKHSYSIKREKESLNIYEKRKAQKSPEKVQKDFNGYLWRAFKETLKVLEKYEDRIYLQTLKKIPDIDPQSIDDALRIFREHENNLLGMKKALKSVLPKWHDYFWKIFQSKSQSRKVRGGTDWEYQLATLLEIFDLSFEKHKKKYRMDFMLPNQDYFQEFVRGCQNVSVLFLFLCTLLLFADLPVQWQKQPFCSFRETPHSTKVQFSPARLEKHQQTPTYQE
ncbi:hypothetical protein AKJ41_05995 [candidate division MSBL1 archaeon SCGC-AAA259O05]|uniref:Uncharacterized protein n=1 Tax=candidate division MSBL1 archaeon SCGC-AAA259O05 TaxID=1698271 RepID=A0A133UXZ7_9EURY|nr:hypothetical protein AKJ41_05995 [candidate division MSBL1 archaeon SCGC-AAA259O05]